MLNAIPYARSAPANPQIVLALYPFAAMVPGIGLPRMSSAYNIPPMPRPDVLVPDEEEDDEEIDLPTEDEPDTGVGRTEQPEKAPNLRREDEIRPRLDENDEPLLPPHEKQRKPEVDDPLPKPEIGPGRVPISQ